MKIEILAPAGGIKQYISAVENGADAVYIGGSKFNARMSANNFTLEEMKMVIDYGHLRGVKTYVTLNTLLKDSELIDALNYAKELFSISVDALIIQDLGLARLIKKYIPDFPIHLSTQGTCYNKEGVLLSKELGFSRTVLARELSLDEIKECCKLDQEIEVFIHGAICYSYSGQCQLSRKIGGRSGNRGECAQPCRLSYSNGECSYPLSPKDLSYIDHLGDLIKIGVKSLKIEGRMKSPEYVGTVVRIYRKYVDLYLKYGKYEVDPIDRLELTQIFNRGFTDGYLIKDNKKDFMSGDTSKNKGIYVGKVLEQSKNGLLCRAKLTKELKMFDVIEIKSNPPFSTMVTYLKDDLIGDMKGEVHYGDEIYRLISSELNKKCEEINNKIDVVDSKIVGKFNRKVDLNFTIIANANSNLKLSIDTTIDEKKYNVLFSDSYIVPLATGKGTTFEDLFDKLSKTGGTPYNLKNLKVISNDNIFIPVSKINEIRRLGIEKLEEDILNSYKRDKVNFEIENLHELEYIDEKEYFFFKFSTYEEFNHEILRNKRVLLPIKEVVENISLIKMLKDKYNENIIPYVLNVSKGILDDYLRSNHDTIIKVVKDLGSNIYLGNMSHIYMFRDSNINLLGDYGLNIYNGEAAKVYEDLGISKYIGSLENIEEKESKFPLMISEHKMEETNLIDRKGVEYSVILEPSSLKSIIINKNGNTQNNREYVI